MCTVILLQGSRVQADAQSDLCIDAARIAAAEHGVPQAVMLAITLTETGRTVQGSTRPWPWAVNSGGESHWFDSAAAAENHAQSRLAAGATSFDLGCFQLNWRWHNAAFGSAAAMLDPLANARYAAEFLARFYRESGDWSVAAGAYHSRTPQYATRYRARFEEYLAVARDMSGDNTGIAMASATLRDRSNAFPLLQANGGGGRLGSLVPLTGLD